jgi:hypothetical protein
VEIDWARVVDRLDGKARGEATAMMAKAGVFSRAWLPNPGPQSDAYFSEADLLLFGGQAGGGKSDLLLGLATGEHKRSVIFRRAYVDLRGVEERLIEINGSRQGYNGHDMVFRRNGRLLEFGALEKPGAEQAWQGRPHDLIGFDEGAQLTAAKVSFVLGWLRSGDENDGQRCRAVIASNPPMGGEGEWLIAWFAPWLDPMHPNPAAPGELRWAYVLGDETVWVDGPGVTVIDGEEYTHLSRTFIPSGLDDNPYLRETGYRARLQSLPEPLRSQLLHGDFMAGREDHEWQIIPSEWVRLAQERWRAAPVKRRKMIALSADIAIGGADNAVLAPLYEDAWFGELVKRKGAAIQDPADIAVLMIESQRDKADLSVDGTGGWGSGVVSNLRNNHDLECVSIIYSAASHGRSKDEKFGYHNKRADMYWSFREALDPDDGDDIMLPPDTRLAATLTAPRYKVRKSNILVEEKEEIKKRLGSSTDEADAVVQAWSRLVPALRRKTPEPDETEVWSIGSGDAGGGAGWMGN